MNVSLDKCLAGADRTRQVDALFVNAPLRDYGLRPRINNFTLPVIGMGYIATYASERGFNVGVTDAEALGLGIEQTIQLVNQISPRWVGFNLLAPTYDISARIAAGLDPSIKIMVGGHQAKAMPMETLADPRFSRIEALILGEGESRVAELLEDVNNRSKLPGVMWLDRNIGKIKTGDGGLKSAFHLAPDLDELPFVDRTFLVDDPFRASDGRLEANIVGARGCPYDCSFCGAAISANPDVTIRTRRPDNIVNEMDSLYSRRDVTAFRFVDDLFLGNERFIQTTIHAFSESNIGNRFVWDGTGRINIMNKLKNETIEKMKENGCREVALGIESGSERLLRYMGKKITPEMTRSVVHRLTSFGINIKGYFILGFPTESQAELDSTVRLVKDLWEISDNQPGRFRASVFEFRPYPGTPEWHRLIATGKFTPEELLEYTAVDLTGDGLDEAMRGRDEFNFSVNIQFGEAPISDVRSHLVELSREQFLRSGSR